MFNQPLIGEIMIQMGFINEAQLHSALERQAEKGGRLGEVLLDLKAVDYTRITQALARQLGYDMQPSVDIEAVELDLLKGLSLRWARDHAVLPLKRVGDHRVLVACEDPLDIRVCDHLRFILQLEPLMVLVPRPALLDATNTAFGILDEKQREADMAETLQEADSPTAEADDVPEIEDLLVGQEDDEAPVIQFVNGVFLRAVRQRVSDIHIEPSEQQLHVRFRVDGVLKEVAQPPKRFQSSIIARIKIMAQLNIAEKRLPQDGRIRIKIAGKDIDVRVATAPTSHGERITMRLLDKSAVKLDLAKLGFGPTNLARIHKIIRQPHGIILVTGPTGSGKTTTLYSALTEINTPDKNILTVEDPVEYQLKGISQMQVNAKINLTFASGLRSYLRHDPDVIMVGEIRDRETAENAIQASLTGHLVLSTLHTNDSAGAFTRIIDMGIEPFLVSSTVSAVLAQRLVRRLCPHCNEAYTPNAEELAEIGLTPQDVEEAGGQIHRAVGCSHCLGVGYQGRLGIYELLLVNDEVQKLVVKESDANTIKRSAQSRGMKTLREDGARKVLQGITTIEEVMRVTSDDHV